MSTIGQIDSSTLANNVYNTSKANQTNRTNQAAKTNQTSQVRKTSSQYGNTVGDPKLSEKAAKYYEELKSKYGDMDFVLVSDDKSDQAEQLASGYANSDKALVLIDESRVEQMAEDEDVRKQYEDIIGSASEKLDEMAESLDKSGMGDKVQGFGIKVNDDGTTSYFAVLKDSSAAQKERIEKQAAQKKEAKKAEDRKAQKKAAEEAREEKISEKDGSVKPARGKDVSEVGKESGLTTVTANSMDELLQKISDSVIAQMSDNIRTPQEMQVGQHFDMKW